MKKRPQNNNPLWKLDVGAGIHVVSNGMFDLLNSNQKRERQGWQSTSLPDQIVPDRGIDMAAPTQARVKEYFNYDPATGDLSYRLRPRSEFSNEAIYAKHLNRVGKVAGCSKNQGYVMVCMDMKYYPAHKIVWLFVTNEWVVYPSQEIDHINGIRDDNRIENLRKVSKSENQRNSGMRQNNTSGVHGVNWKPHYHNKVPSGGGWVARIWNGPRHVYLGVFDSLREAEIARKAAERVLGYTGSDRPPRYETPKKKKGN